MPRYHISEDGTPRVCRASKRECRFSSTGHFDSPEAASENFEKTMTNPAETQALRKKSKIYSWPQESETRIIESKTIPGAKITLQLSNKFRINFNGTHHSLEAWLSTPGEGNVSYVRLLVRDPSYSAEAGDHLAMCDIETRIDQRGKGFAKALREDLEEETGLLIYSSGGYTPEGFEAFAKHNRYLPGALDYGSTPRATYNPMGFVVSWKDKLPLNSDQEIDYTDEQREAFWNLEEKFRKFRSKELMWSED